MPLWLHQELRSKRTAVAATHTKPPSVKARPHGAKPIATTTTAPVPTPTTRPTTANPSLDNALKKHRTKSPGVEETTNILVLDTPQKDGSENTTNAPSRAKRKLDSDLTLAGLMFAEDIPHPTRVDVDFGLSPLHRNRAGHPLQVLWSAPELDAGTEQGLAQDALLSRKGHLHASERIHRTSIENTWDTTRTALLQPHTDMVAARRLLQRDGFRTANATYLSDTALPALQQIIEEESEAFAVLSAKAEVKREDEEEVVEEEEKKEEVKAEEEMWSASDQHTREVDEMCKRVEVRGRIGITNGEAAGRVYIAQMMAHMVPVVERNVVTCKEQRCRSELVSEEVARRVEASTAMQQEASEKKKF